jgi:Zn-dependent oligopeptidase
MNSMQDRFVSTSITKAPQATIICNFAPPTSDGIALLTFDEVQTLFHEMGHSLHHLLTTINHFNIYERTQKAIVPIKPLQCFL